MDKVRTINGLADSLAANVPKPAEKTFIGADGLLYCSKCGTKVQTRVTILGKERVMPCVCKCMAEKYKAEDVQREAENFRRRVAELKAASLMDSAYTACSFETARLDTDNKKQMAIAAKYAGAFREMRDRNRGLLFYGPPGTGKTYAAACIANKLLAEGFKVVMTSFVRVNALDFEEREAIIQTMADADLLIIDDLGAERNTSYSIEKVYDIIDSRVRVNLPLILTTNLTIAQMRNNPDVSYERIYDRVFQVCYPVECKGASWRADAALKMQAEMSAFFKV
ncbi:MAG: ATP-binding protein [Lachnospiraceae bacterium]|nr:ATP-binding protein [Lachnospiraceae bacterium]